MSFEIKMEIPIRPNIDDLSINQDIKGYISDIGGQIVSMGLLETQTNINVLFDGDPQTIINKLNKYLTEHKFPNCKFENLSGPTPDIVVEDDIVLEEQTEVIEEKTIEEVTSADEKPELIPADDEAIEYAGGDTADGSLTTDEEPEENIESSGDPEFDKEYAELLKEEEAEGSMEDEKDSE